MRRRPERCDALEEIVLRAVPAYREVSFGEVARAVLDDYGSVTYRTVSRYLASLHRRRLIQRSGIVGRYVYSRRIRTQRGRTA